MIFALKQTRLKKSLISETQTKLAKFSFVRDLLLDPEQHRGVPLIQPRDGVVVLDLVGKSLNILVLQVFAQGLKDTLNF